MNTFRMTLVLFIVCCFSALSLSFLYVNTQPKIELNKETKKLKLKKLVVPKAESFVDKTLNNLQIEECFDTEKNFAGILIKNTCKGYAGNIEYLVGITPEIPPKIINIKILSHKETPGLGANVAKEKFLSQFVGKTPQEILLKKDNITGKIDAITGATITSRAITNSLNSLMNSEELQNYIRDYVAKTQQKEEVKKGQPVKLKKTSLDSESKPSFLLEQSTSTHINDFHQPQ